MELFPQSSYFFFFKMVCYGDFFLNPHIFSQLFRSAMTFARIPFSFLSPCLCYWLDNTRFSRGIPKLPDLTYLERLTRTLCSREGEYKQRCQAYEALLDEILDFLEGSNSPHIDHISSLITKYKLRELENE